MRWRPGTASPSALSRWTGVEGVRKTQNVWIKRALLVLLMGIVSIVAVNFVGDTTIYSLKLANVREELHESVVHNRPPASVWTARGSKSLSLRIAIPYFVEFVHEETSVGVLRLYKGVDLMCIWLS